VIIHVSVLLHYSVTVPSQEPFVNSTLVSTHARFISFDFEPPPVDSWNGILGGYVLSYTNHEFDSTLKRTIDDPEEEVSLLSFHSASAYYAIPALF